MLRFIGILIQLTFYTFYVGKALVQKHQAIRTNQMGRGNKTKTTLHIERIMACATVLALLFSIGSILFAKPQRNTMLAVAGVICGVAGVAFFAAATLTMKDSWRVGIPDEKTALITGGIYRISRNPAFMGFDLLYLSTNLLFPNAPLALVTLWAVVMLHMQILQEEKHLQNTFGAIYTTYARQTRRYLGRF